MEAYIGEFIGTMILIILGDGVVAGVLLRNSKAENSGWIVITFGWAMAVAVAVYCVGQFSGAHINPAVTIAFAVTGQFPLADVIPYIIAQFLGAFVGGVIVWLAYLAHWPETEDEGLKLGVFCTAPAIYNTPANVITEIIGTFVLVFGGPRQCRGGYRKRHQPAARRPAGPRHRALFGWAHRLRHQPGTRPRPTNRPRRSAHSGQRRQRLGVCLDPRRSPNHRRYPRRRDVDNSVLIAR
jgi:hypothetical protein